LRWALKPRVNLTDNSCIDDVKAVKGRTVAKMRAELLRSSPHSVALGERGSLSGLARSDLIREDQMTPYETLEEVDRLGLIIWHQPLDERNGCSFYKRIVEIDTHAPAELRAAIRRNNNALLKIATWKPGRKPGVQIRKPRQP
jgi:hypothetical protein